MVKEPVQKKMFESLIIPAISPRNSKEQRDPSHLGPPNNQEIHQHLFLVVRRPKNLITTHLSRMILDHILKILQK